MDRFPDSHWICDGICSKTFSNIGRMRTLEEGGEKGKDEIFEGIMTHIFSKMNVRHQTTDPGISRYTKRLKI